VKRSGWITGVIVVHGLWALTLASISVYLLVLVRTSAIRRDIEVPDATAGLRAAAAVMLVLTLLAALSWYGLRKEMLWGWWVALLADAAVLGMFIYSMIDEGWRIDWDMATFSALSAILPTLLLLPAVRKFYRHLAKVQSVESPS